MQPQSVQLINFSVEQLFEAFKPLFDAAYNKKELVSTTTASPINNPIGLTRKEAALLLKIKPQTLDVHNKKGIIKSYNVGRRVMYLHADLVASLVPNNKKGLN